MADIIHRHRTFFVGLILYAVVMSTAGVVLSVLDLWRSLW